MKKLLIVTDNFLTRIDGISIFLSNILPALTKEYEVTVVAPRYGKVTSDNYKLVTIPLSKWKLGDYVSARLEPSKIRGLVKKSDLVFTQTIGPVGFFGIWYAKKFKKPCVSFMHSIEWELVPMSTRMIVLRKIFYTFVKMLARFTYNKTNLMIIPSEGILEKLSWHRIRAKKEVVNLGVNSDYFVPYKEMSDMKKKKIDLLRIELGLENSFVIGNHGRFAREKDLVTLLRAFNWMKRKHDNVKLLVIGDGLVELKKKFASVKGVVVVTSTLDIAKYLALMDVYVTSSLTETTSLSTLEAMSTGLPVVSTPVGFIKEYINDNVNGFFFPKRNEYSLFKKIDLLMNNKPLAKTIGERARRTVKEKFKWSDTVSGIKNILEKQNG